MERQARETEAKIAAVSDARARAEERWPRRQAAGRDRGGIAGARRGRGPGDRAGRRADGGRRRCASSASREPHRADHAGARAPRPHRARRRPSAIERERWHDALGRRRPADRDLEGAPRRGARRDRQARRRCPRMIERAAPEADERAGRRPSGAPVAADALAAADTAHRQAAQALRAAQAPSPTSARRAPAPRRGSEGARARAPRRRAASASSSACAPGRLPGAGRDRAAAPTCRRWSEATASSRASRPIASGSAASTCRPTRTCTGLSPAVRRPGHGEGRRRGRHRQAARRHRPDQRRGPQAACRTRSTRSTRHFAEPVHDAVRRRRGAPRDDRGRGPAGGRPGDRRQAARQEAGDAVAAVGRRAVADRAWR